MSWKENSSFCSRSSRPATRVESTAQSTVTAPSSTAALFRVKSSPLHSERAWAIASGVASSTVLVSRWIRSNSSACSLPLEKSAMSMTSCPPLSAWDGACSPPLQAARDRSMAAASRPVIHFLMFLMKTPPFPVFILRRVSTFPAGHSVNAAEQEAHQSAVYQPGRQ